MFESFKISVEVLDTLAHECPMPESNSEADCSQDFYEKILEACTHDGVIDGADLSALNFPFDINNDTPIHYDVFISYSHLDEEKAEYLHWFLTTQCKLHVFLDSTIWHSADLLLKAIDDKYCKNTTNNNYNYNKRNFSTSHVHTLLSMAMLNAIKRSECFLFIESNNSLTLKDGIHDHSLSPWIYQENEFANSLPKILPRRLQSEFIEKAFAITESLATGGILKMQHALKTRLFLSLDVNDLKMMQDRKGTNGLDSLYYKKGIIR